MLVRSGGQFIGQVKLHDATMPIVMAQFGSLRLNAYSGHHDAWDGPVPPRHSTAEIDEDMHSQGSPHASCRDQHTEIQNGFISCINQQDHATLRLFHCTTPMLFVIPLWFLAILTDLDNKIPKVNWSTLFMFKKELYLLINIKIFYIWK